MVLKQPFLHADFQFQYSFVQFDVRLGFVIWRLANFEITWSFDYIER